ncbi:MAG: NAD-dependent epimerase/dehydratase family protein [Hyphomicrobiales bacterium]|nr:NAD-dependent epimerase/dehydratase family protein [Hyphomicrobiales bacterium]
MGMIITGATGHIGRNIIPLLAQHGEKLLLVGRDEERLKTLFPEAEIASYENLANSVKGFDILLHLAIRNSDSPGTTDEFEEANLQHLKNVIHLARSVGIKTIIFPSSLWATPRQNSSPYLKSKYQAEKYLSKLDDLKVVCLRLPAVYSDTFQGRLAILNRIPVRVRPVIFSIMAAFKPTVHADKVATAVLDALQGAKNINKIVSDRQFGNWFYSAIKRTIDLGFCIFVFVFFWWLLILVWIAIKLLSPGPGIFAQERIGKNGQSFTCYKFRTMKEGTRHAATHQVSSSNVTAVGRMLRKTKIDELPQIWNLLRGNMTLVGPRPCLPSQTVLIDYRQRRGVLKVKGGITGWAQIQGVDMSDPKRLSMLDSEYLDLRSLVMDLKIILATATGHGLGDRTE